MFRVCNFNTSEVMGKNLEKGGKHPVLIGLNCSKNFMTISLLYMKALSWKSEK